MQWPAVHDNLSLVNENNIFYATYLSEYIPNNFVEAPSWIVINNYDSQLNLNFQEIYGGDAFYIPHCVASTHDSGFVVASSRYDWKTQDMERDVYVLKVNKEGLIVRVEGEKTNYSNEVVVFPNPGKNAIHIETQYLQSVLKMFNLSGILELEQNLYSKSSVVKVNDLIPGAYVYQIYKNKKMVKQGLWIKN